jgi:hypothetical protein
MAKLSFEQKLDKITAKIVDVKMDNTNKRGVVSVEITSGKDKWYKPFGISTEQGVIKWEDFVTQVQKAVKKDMEKDIALKEITKKEGVVFNLFN